MHARESWPTLVRLLDAVSLQATLYKRTEKKTSKTTGRQINEQMVFSSHGLLRLEHRKWRYTILVDLEF